MRSRVSWRVFLWAALGAALGAAALPGCPRGPRAGPTARRDPNVVVAYVACALVPAAEAAKERFEAAHAEKSVEIEAGLPGELSKLILAGHVPDVLICIGNAEIGMLEREGLVGRMPVEATPAFRLVIAAPAQVETPAVRCYQDLASPEVKTIAMPPAGTTSLGRDAARALDKLKLWGKIQDRLKVTETPLQALELLAAGKADAAIIYDPCPALELTTRLPRDSVVVVAPLLPDGERRTTIHAGIHKSSPHAPLAKLFLRYLEHEDGTAEAVEEAAGAAPEAEPPG